MRAIKFRAFYEGDIEEWEYNGNARMIYDIQNAYDGTGFDDPEGRFGWVSCFSDFMDDEKMSVMQYTGLKDKNGVEIYEGDILKVANGAEEMEGTDTGIGVVEWLDKWGFWNVSDIENGLGDLMYNGYVEVIGNIYEHKHLLD